VETTKKIDFKTVKIEGERVLFSSLTSEYRKYIFKEFTKEITRFMFPASPSEISEIDSFIERSREGMENKTDLVLVITDKNNNDFLGICGLHGNKRPKEPELGIWLKKSAHSKYLGREAIKYLVSWVQKNIEYNYLVYPVDKENIPSRKIAEYLGGKVFHENTKKNMSGNILNEVTYKIM